MGRPPALPGELASADRIIPELQHLAVGDVIPDGAPQTGCGLIVESLEPERCLVLHSTSHPPKTWRDRGLAALDWSWVFVLDPVGADRRTRFHVRSRWTTSPWWMTLGGWLVIVPADFVMARDMLHGVKTRAEKPPPTNPRARLAAANPAVQGALYLNGHRPATNKVVGVVGTDDDPAHLDVHWEKVCAALGRAARRAVREDARPPGQNLRRFALGQHHHASPRALARMGLLQKIGGRRSLRCSPGYAGRGLDDVLAHSIASP